MNVFSEVSHTPKKYKTSTAHFKARLQNKKVGQFSWATSMQLPLVHPCNILLHVINLVFSLFNAFFSGSTGE
jgi:hypothetical protein